MRHTDLTNKRFGRLFVVGLSHVTDGKKRAYWQTWCDCGAEKNIRADHLTSGVVQSCGCMRKERAAAASTLACLTHGMTGTPTYRSWAMMKVRCLNKENHKFPDYGGRGIRICERWHSFDAFLADMGPRPPGTSLDRIDVNGNYEPGNCRWADAKTQRANRRDTLKQEGI